MDPVGTPEPLCLAAALRKLGLPPLEADKIGKALTEPSRKTIEAGDTLIAEGDLVEEVYLVSAGMLRSSDRALGPGQVVGDSYFTGRPSLETVSADESSSVFVLSGAELEWMTQLSPAFAGVVAEKTAA